MYEAIKEQIIAKYEARGKVITEKSVVKYINDIKKIQSLVDAGEATDLSFLYDVDAVSASIEDMRGRKVVDGQKVKASTNTKRNYYQSIVSVLDALDDYKVIKKYQTIVNKYNKLYKVNLDKNNASVTQENEEKLISYKSLKHVVDGLSMKIRDIKDAAKDLDYKLTDTDMNTFQTFILLKMYMSFPARNEFGTILWATDLSPKTSDNNYLALSTSLKKKKSELTLNVYKTSGLYDTRVLDLDANDKLTGHFTTWRKMLARISKQEGRGVVKTGTPVFYSRFYNKPDEEWWRSPMTSNKLSKYLARFFEKEVGKNISTTAIAKIVNSHQNKTNSDAIKKNSKARGTSVGTLSQVYTPVLPQ